MNGKAKIFGWVLMAGLLLAPSLQAQGGRKQQMGGDQVWLKFEKELALQTRYSVDMEIQAMGMAMPSKVFRLDGKTRSEMTLPFMNMRIVALQVPVNGKAVNYSLFPDKKKYCITPEGEADDPNAPKPQYKLEELGTEAYEGATCKKRRMTVTMADGTVSEMIMLFSPAQKNMPVKIDGRTTVKPEPGAEPMVVTSQVLFKNYQFAAPDAALFTIPKDYAQAANMSEVMMSGGAFGGFGQAAQPAAGQPAEVQEALRQAQREQQAQQAEAAAAQKQATQDAVNQSVKEGIGRGLRSLLGQ